MKLYQKPRFLSDDEMQRIHEASLYLLEKKGVVFKSKEAVEILTGNGCTAEGKTVFFPRAVVERCLETVPATFRIDAVNSEHSFTVGEGLIIHPAGGEVFLQKKGAERVAEPGMKEFEDLQKLYQYCKNMNMAGYQPLSPADVPLGTRNLRCLYASMLYSDKAWLAPMDNNSGKDKHRELEMYEIVYGSGFLKDHYVTWSIVTPESPMVYSKFSCESIIEYSRLNQPVALVSAPMSGITSPVHILGTIVQANTETLAGLCLAQCVNPGVPVLPSASLTYGNLKLATWECSSPDTALMLAGAIQMYKEFYHLPARAQTGVTSSKCVDYQAGMESVQSLLLTALMDVDVTSQSMGTLENLMAISFEKTLIDDELVGRVRRIIDGIEFTDETLSLDVIMETKHGGNFLMAPSTVKYMRDGWQPQISDWNSFEPWSKSELRDIEERAEKKVREVIENAPRLLDPDTDKALRRFIDEAENNA